MLPGDEDKFITGLAKDGGFGVSLKASFELLFFLCILLSMYNSGLHGGLV